jgi:hypothetical protein
LGGAQPALAGVQDGFVARLNVTLTTLNQATYLGGSAGDPIYSIAIHPGSGEVYVAGITSSTDYPGTAAGGAQPATGGDTDVFVARLTADLAGLDASKPRAFHTVTACRLVDTRAAAGLHGGPRLAAGSLRTFPVTGFCGIPASAAAVAFNVAVTQPTATGHLRLFPGGTKLPLISSINYRGGQTRANNATVPLGVGGSVAVYCGQGSGSAHMLLDVNGYYE